MVCFEKKKMKIKLTFKIWLWLIILSFSLLSIFITPNFLQKGVVVSSIETNSPAFEEGLRQGDIIISIDGQKIEHVENYLDVMQNKFLSGEKVRTIITTTKSEFVFFSNESLKLVVSEIPRTNVKTGLDLSGGARALIQAENYSLSSEDVNNLIDMISNRFNVYGISDMDVRSVSDLAGKNFVQIEIAGATPKDLENLISQQGKFEAKIGNETVFVGGKDIKNVKQAGQDVGIFSCEQFSQGYVCSFRFPILISQESAERMAEITSKLDVVKNANGQDSLSEPLNLYLDEMFYSNLSISADLKGNPATQISIQGSGRGETKLDAYNNAAEEMKNLQTVLMTGSLPFKLQIVKLDTISPTLGQNFTKYLLIAGLIALLSVAIILFIRYKGLKSSFAPLLICTSEIIITIGVAAFIKWDLDLPSIAGILAAIGTGIDDQIVVLDEAKNKESSISIKERIKKAFIIIIGAYVTSVASLLPLWWAGAGLLKGFVFTTLIGITIGVLITRPAFADIVKITEKN